MAESEETKQQVDTSTPSTASTTSTRTSTLTSTDAFGWWRGAQQLCSLFQLICDVCASPDIALLKKKSPTLLPSLLRWGTESFLSLPDTLLKKEDTDHVYLMLRKCEEACHCFERPMAGSATSTTTSSSSSGGGGETPETDSSEEDEEALAHTSLPPHFAFQFWLQVTTQYMQTGGLPQRLFALDQIASLDRRAQAGEPAPFQLQVQGAGHPQVDGVYTMTKDLHKHAHMWYCSTNDLTIFRCSMQAGNQHHWFISRADKKAPGTDKDVDYYTCKEGSLLPPSSGWIPCGKTVQPNPRVTKIDPTKKASTKDEGKEEKEEKEEKEVAEEQNETKLGCLLSWIHSSKLLREELLGERMHKQLLGSRAQPLLTTMARHQVMDHSHLLLLWNKGKDLHCAGEVDLSLSVFALLVGTMQHYTPSLLLKLLHIIQHDAFPPTRTTSTEKTGKTEKTEKTERTGEYNAVCCFLGLLNSSPSVVGMITSKGKEIVKYFIKLVWKLLTVQNVLNDSVALASLVADGNKQELTRVLVRPNDALSQLLIKVMKDIAHPNSSIRSVGEGFRKAYIAQCMQVMDASIADVEVRQVGKQQVQESFYIRTLTLMKGKFDPLTISTIQS